MSKIMRWIIAAIVLLTAAAAVWHLESQPKAVGGVISVQGNGVESLVDLEEFPLEPVCGELTDGKGEKLQIKAEGILLKDVLGMAGIEVEKLETVSVIAADAYRAEIEGAELMEEKVWLLVCKNSAELVVFGDENRKRNVANVLQLEAK